MRGTSTSIAIAVIGIALGGAAGYWYFAGDDATPGKAPLSAVPQAQNPGQAQVSQAAGPMPEIAADDMVLGSPDAKVTIVEYASLTCPHCMRFHTETLPKLKAEFIDTGKVKLVYRDFPFDQAGLRAAMMARCGGKDRFFGFLDALFKSMDQWAREQDWRAALARIGKLGGMSQESFDKCLADAAVETAILNKRLEAAQKFGVESTPTFFINGEKVAGAYPLDHYVQIIKRKLPAS
ncbi:MAG: thioredoxin domain-containing protein [Rhodospirillales bacterium]